MMPLLQRALLFFCFVIYCDCVHVTPNPKYSFEQCLITKTSFGYCVGVSALNKLQSIDNDPVFDIVDGVSFIRDEQRPRTASNFLERDPHDFGGIFDTVGNVISQRMMRWDMSTLYPGLVMRVTPSVDGVLEFVMDPLQEDLTLKNIHGSYKEIGTGRIMARTFLLPLLLGFKFKVATLIPIIFGVLALLAKKALFLSKAALLISSSIALGSLLFNKNSYASSGGNHHQHFGGYGGYGGHHHHPTWNLHQGLGYKTDEASGDYSDLQYKGYANQINGQDQLKFSPPLTQQFAKNDGRNFAWNDSGKDVQT